MTTTMTQKGLTGFHLKYIALLTMTIDHIGAVLLPYGTTAYTVCRGIGRIAFPIFCFLLVEGYFHTSNHRAYFTRLFLFAFISEIPFDMALFGFPAVSEASVLNGHQNVFFTLAFGFLAICLVDRYLTRGSFVGAILIAIISISAELLHFDYGAIGILVILIFYAYQRFYTGCDPRRAYLVALLPLLCYGNLCVLLALPFLTLYNGQKGSPLPQNGSFPGAKYLFYVYYPIHLFVLAML